MGIRDKIVKALAGIKAYHSSPHDFDKFDLSKIGTGEGAQVYGHGIYAAENPAVSGQGGQYWQQFKSRFSEPEVLAAEKLQRTGFDRAKAIADQQAEIDDIMTAISTGKLPPNVVGDYTDPILIQSIGKSMLRDRQEQLDLLTSGKPVGPRTYELNIRADPAQMLDWDKPLAAQTPQVQSGVEKYIRAKSGEDIIWRTLGGEHINLSQMSPQERMVNERLIPKLGGQALPAWQHDLLTESPATIAKPPLADAAFASRRLQEVGIPGIKYLDEGSRGRQFSNKNALFQEPLTSNYVIFDPANIDIVKKYGVAGAPVAGGMGALFDQGQYEEMPR